MLQRPGSRKFLVVLALLSGLGCYAADGRLFARGAAASTLTAPGPLRASLQGQWSATSGPPDGLVTSLVVRDTFLFAGTEGNGVYRSSNNGINWLAVNTGLTNRLVYSLGVQGNTLFAGTDRGILFRSTDNGQNWVPASLGSANGNVTALAANNDTVFAAIYGEGVFRSTNGGISWNSANIDLTNPNVTALATNGATIFAGTEGGGLFRSDNNGASWRIINLGLTSTAVKAFAVNGNTLYVGTDGGGVFRSANNGLTFTPASNGLFSNNRVAALALSGATLFAGMRSAGVYRSFNEGNTWTSFNAGLTNSDVLALVTIDTRLFAGTFSGDGVFVYDFAAAGCGHTLAPTSQTVPASSGTSSVAVTAGAGCIWAARSNASWLTLTAGSTGSGNGTVNYTVAANTGSQRSGTLTIAGKTFTVTQEMGCTFTLSSTSQSFAASGGNGSVNVAALQGCAWTVTSNVPWITVTNGASGNGNGTVNYSVAANPSPQRTGTLTIAGQPYTVTQADGCAFSLNPTNQSVVASGGTGSVELNTGAGCNWTASSNAAWLSVTPSGSGPGPVNYTVAVNTGPSRTGTLTIAGQTFTVNQASGCAFTINPTNQSFAASGGTGSVSVSTTTGCTWTATSNAAWLSITAGSSGNGNGSVSYSVTANTGPPRSGTLTIAGKTFTVNQADGCVFALSSNSQSFAASGGPGSVNVNTAAGCEWTATSNAAWLTVNAGSSGNGAGTVNYSVAANTGPPRTGTLTVAGQTFTVTQSSGCVFSLNPTAQSFAASGGSDSVSVTTTAGCTWTATSNVAWVNIVAGASGEGNGAVNYSVAANSGPTRSGTLTIAGQTFTVSQADGCAFALSQTSQRFTASGGAASVNVNAAAGCVWTAASNAEWIAITSGNNGNGNGTVNYSVAPNSGPARSGTLTIAGQTFTVTQADGCAYTIAPTSQSFSADGGTGSVTVTAGAGCNWTASSDSAWLTITSGGTGSGNGAVNYSVAPNPSTAARSGILTIAGQPFTLTQTGLNPSPGLTSLSPDSTASGGPAFTLTVNGASFVNGAVVRWNNSDRLTTFVSSTRLTAQIPASDVAGTGTASVSVFNPAPGGGPSNSLSFTINLICNYGLQPTNQAFSANGGTGSVNVTVASGCAWVAFSNADWLSITLGSSGNGNGVLSYSVAPNNDTAVRSGTLTVAGQTFTVNQAGAPPAPTLSGLDPNNTVAGGPAFALTVRGANFTNLSVVRWNGAERATTFASSTQLSAQIPASDIASPGNATITVFTPAPGGGASNALNFVINQRCTYSLQPDSQAFGANGGAGSVTVTTQSGCAWTATSQENWIVVTSGSGSGNGTVNYAVGANTNPTERSGTLMIAGQTFTVRQAGAPPAISSLNPANAPTGGPAFTLTVNGANFISNSIVRWNGSDRLTTFIDSTRVTAQILASDIANPGAANLTVFNPAPGNGSSNTQRFEIANPVPVLTALEPDTALVGSAPFTLLVNGANFVNGATIIWGGNPLNTNFISSTRLSAQLTANELASAGMPDITVSNPAPGGGRSNQLIFTLNNPRPSLVNLAPNTIVAGSGAFVLAVNGSGFIASSVVRWNGVSRPTAFVNNTQLTAQITDGDVATAGTARILVFNPGPGGGLSDELTLTVMPQVSGNTISGEIRHSISSRPVPGVVLTAALGSGGAEVRNESDGEGRYALRGLSNVSYTVTPTKTRSRSGITAFDAARILQEAASPLSLTPEQFRAADVDGDLRVTTADAELLANYIVEKAGTGRTGEWTFDPPNQQYPPLTGNQANQNFRARLAGDVSGNWSPSAGLSITALSLPAGAPSASAHWLIRGTGFEPGLALVLLFPAGGELRVSAPLLTEVAAESFRLHLPLGVRGVWAARVVNADGRSSDWFAFKVE